MGNNYGSAPASYGGGYSGSAVAAYSVGGSYTGNVGSAEAAYFGSGHKEANYTRPDAHAESSMVDVFLEETRPWTPIISQMEEVRPIVEETFERITGQPFPHDGIRMTICTPEDFQRAHQAVGGNAAPGVVGFSLNKYAKGVSDIVIKADHLDSVLLTIGHEIGHVLSPTLPNPQDEEAKAHAFSIAWMETIREHNIAGLTPNIRLNPAHNGLHDVALNFVNYLMKTGATAHDVFKTLAHGLTSIIAGG